MKRLGLEGSIVLGAAIIALAILFVGRWQIAGAPNAALRIDRWTGKVVACVQSPDWEGAGGIQLDCVPVPPKPKEKSNS
jgi:hypothetical protein